MLVGLRWGWEASTRLSRFEDTLFLDDDPHPRGLAALRGRLEDVRARRERPALAGIPASVHGPFYVLGTRAVRAERDGGVFRFDARGKGVFISIQGREDLKRLWRRAPGTTRPNCPWNGGRWCRTPGTRRRNFPSPFGVLGWKRDASIALPRVGDGWLSARREPLRHLPASPRRTHPGQSANRNGDCACFGGRRQRTRRNTFRRLHHDSMKQWAGARHAAHAIHRTSTEVACPHRDSESARRADGPVVGEVSARSGLHRDGKWKIEWRLETEARHARRGIVENVEYDRTRHRRDDATTRRAARRTLHGMPRPRAPLATVRERAIGVGELDERHITVPERETEPVILSVAFKRREASEPQRLQQRSRSQSRRQLDRGNVV